ncbi:pyridoxal phosphate-dependent transferase [Polychytrium aggregatum]|uniref:pyridoxal phosphate-dependent transferase n=1 Tax=Polychytrium aggregatum TaxID=110093 RepID=UPI0022FE9682|nr:pyridoxal phosphate-dependent transferase [Polychytrium aggregatum]KAI9206318.1 pyridoxal phosphate-dependent transferase [Polychytrium aggregatum]
MDVNEFRKRGHEAVERIARYYEQELANHNVQPTVQPGFLKSLLPAEAPEEGESWDAIQQDFESKIIPGVTHWQSPNFFGFFPANSSFPGIIGDMYSDMLNGIGFNWMASPSCTELETITLDWMAKLIGLDDGFLSESEGGGVIQGSASEAVVVAMLAAKKRAMLRSEGLDERKLVAYVSSQSHSCGLKASMIIGVQCKVLDVDADFALSGAIVRAQIEEDLKAGLVPFFIHATIGTTSSGTVDHIPEIVEAVVGTDVWVHIDAAWAGPALMCEEYRHHGAGVDRSDSFCMNAHKWMLTNFDCSLLWVKHRRYLLDALSLTPAYLRNKETESGLVTDYKDWQLPLGRRFRSLKLWFVLRTYGAQGIRAHIRKHCDQAAHFESRLRAESLFRVVTPRSFALVTFQVDAPTLEERNRRTEWVYNQANATRRIFITSTKLRDQYVIRFVPGSPHTEMAHVDGAFDMIREFAASVPNSE